MIALTIWSSVRIYSLTPTFEEWAFRLLPVTVDLKP